MFATNQPKVTVGCYPPVSTEQVQKVKVNQCQLQRSGGHWPGQRDSVSHLDIRLCTLDIQGWKLFSFYDVVAWIQHKNPSWPARRLSSCSGLDKP